MEETLSVVDTGAGFSVSASGNFALIGAPLDDDNGADSGSAYVYQNVLGAWIPVTKLNAPDGAVDDNFGFSVSISGNIALIGSPNDDDTGADSGSVYVYENIAGTWTFVTKLTAPDGAAGDSFGYNVAISGDIAVIGSPYDDDNGLDSGSARK